MFAELSKAFIFQKFAVKFYFGLSLHIFQAHGPSCLWKMSATPGACIKPGLVRWPLCHKVNLPSCVARRPLCHKVKLPRCEARRRHVIMTCDIFDTGQTITLTLCYLLWKTYKSAHSSATLESLKSTRSTKLLENLLTRAAHTFHRRLWQG